MIFVNPGLKLAMVHIAVRPKPADPQAGREAIALWSALEQQFDGGARQLHATTRTEAFGLANPVVSFWHGAAVSQAHGQFRCRMEGGHAADSKRTARFFRPHHASRQITSPASEARLQNSQAAFFSRNPSEMLVNFVRSRIAPKA